MPRRVDVTFELPDEVAPNLRDEDLAGSCRATVRVIQNGSKRGMISPWTT
jgi:hypothetical protein